MRFCGINRFTLVTEINGAFPNFIPSLPAQSTKYDGLLVAIDGVSAAQNSLSLLLYFFSIKRVYLLNFYFVRRRLMFSTI